MKTLLSAASLALALAMGAHAASITAAGELENLTPTGFGGGTDIADLDAESTGTDGFILFNSIPEGGNLSGAAWDLNIVDQKPAYITTIDSGTSTSSGGWAGYDDVTIGGNTYNTGGIVRAGVGTSTEAEMFTFTMGAGVPASLRIGIIIDNSDGAAWDASNVRIEGPGAVSADSDTTIDGGLDLVQFTIDGALDAEVYTVYATSPPSGALIAGITFDTDIDLTDPTDSDNDNMGDNWETYYFGDLTTSDGTGDGDSDDLTDLEEWTEGTKPDNPDSDGDSVSDGDEVSNANGSVTNPNSMDTDLDELLDGWEIMWNLSPTDPSGENGKQGDPDSDGLDNIDEQTNGTDPHDEDTDDDLLSDLAEDLFGDWLSVDFTGTDPTNPDSDGDGLEDGVENPDLPYDPENPTTQSGTDPNLPDSDFDGVSDGDEVARGFDPTDDTSTPPADVNLWSVDIQGIPGIFASQPVLMTGSDLYSSIISGIWNAFDLVGHEGTSLDPTMALVDSLGVAGPVTFTVFGTVSSFSNTPGAAPLTNDYMFLGAGNADAEATWEIAGLTPLASYTFIAYGGIGRDMGMTVDTNGDGLLTDETLTNVPGAGHTFQITAGADGKLVGAIAAGTEAESNWGGWQIQLESAPPEVDTDMDGLTDSEENTHGTDRFNPDTDGDGQGDGAEVLAAGTNPLDPNSVLRILAISYPGAGNNVNLTWSSVPGKSYTIAGSTNGTDWTNVATNIPAADPQSTTSADADNPAAGTKLYRVSVTAP